MMILRRALAIFVLVTAAGELSKAQVPTPSLRIDQAREDSLQPNNASVNFDKALNTYHWLGKLFFQTRTGPLSLRLGEQFLSTVIRSGRPGGTSDRTAALF